MPANTDSPLPPAAVKPRLTRTRSLRYHDTVLIVIMALLAACGLIYEYLMAHYAGRILGALDTTLYSMIGVMIVAMGIGAFYARVIRCPYTGFAWLEAFIALLGATAVLMMAGLFSVSYVLPSQLQDAFGLHETLHLYGGALGLFSQLAEVFPYLSGFILGVMVGMEIPLIARIRESIHEKHLKHNTGTIYGADYIGAGLGAAIWVLICIKLPIIVAAAATAWINFLVGCFFLLHYRKQIRKFPILLFANGVLFVILIGLTFQGQRWLNELNNMLYKDEVVYSENTPYQNIVITRRIIGGKGRTLLSFYINGHIQFASNDEAIYHGMLTMPAMAAAPRNDRVLVVGGGDGLAVRDILRWNPKSVDLIDLDPSVIALFRGRQYNAPAWLNQQLLDLNQDALNDARIAVYFGDAFVEVEKLADQEKKYDVIIVDLPDPNHPDLNKLYSDYFYAKLAELLSRDGVISIQSGSPYHAREAFVSIGKTLETAGFDAEQYHTNIPSFGEWGWTIGTLSGPSARSRLSKNRQLEVFHPGTSYSQVMAAFVFADDFFQGRDEIEVNRLNTPTLYRYHSEGWRAGGGIFFLPGLDD